MEINQNDINRTNDELQEEANNPNTTEKRVKEILAILLTRTIEEWKKPEWFIEWARTTPKEEAIEFLESTKNNLITLEMYELVNPVDQFIGQLNIFNALREAQ